MTTVAGTCRWIANYSGDANNSATANGCNKDNEAVTVTKKSPTISTLATDGGVPGDKIHDTSALSGAFLPTGGTVLFKLYGPGDDTCTGAVTFTSTVNISGTGTATSGDFTTVLAGTYHWIASYSGDANNEGVTGLCTDEHETTTIAKFNPEISTSLTSGNTSDAKITILFGSSVTDQATLTKFGAGAGGTVTYTVWSDSECKVWYADGGIKDVVDGVPGASDSVSFPTPGKYYWTADYSGDVNNAPANSACGDEVVTVTTPNIVVEKTVDDSHTTTAVPGQTIHYKISVTNTGDATGTADVTDDVTAILAHAAIQPGDISDGGVLDAGVITWPQFSLAPSASKTLTFDAKLDGVFPDGTTHLPNAVVVVGTGSNCAPQANQDADCNTDTTVVAHPNIQAEKTVNGEHHDQALPGDVLDYAIVVTNTGHADGTADVTDDVTAILAHATISDINFGGSLAGNVITWPQFNLEANGGTKTLTFKATLGSVFPDGTTTLPNAAVVVGTGSNCAPTAEQDADCNTLTDVSEFTLTIEKTNNAPIETLDLPDDSAGRSADGRRRLDRDLHADLPRGRSTRGRSASSRTSLPSRT